MTRPDPLPRGLGSQAPAVPSQTAGASALELLAAARQYVPSLTRLAGQIDVLLGLEGITEASEDRDLVWEQYGAGWGLFRPEAKS